MEETFRLNKAIHMPIFEAKSSSLTLDSQSREGRSAARISRIFVSFPLAEESSEIYSPRNLRAVENIHLHSVLLYRLKNGTTCYRTQLLADE